MKEILGLIAVILTLIGLGWYILDIFKSKTKPHLFTWIVWTIVTILVFFGQWQKGGGAGAWTTAVTGIITILIAILAFKKGSKDITKLDQIFFAAALISIIPWLLTKDPTLSVVILTLIDVSAFIPTIRKIIKNPGSETLATYELNIIRHGISILALANYNLATYIFPAALFIMNIIVVFAILRPRFKKV